MTNDEVHSAVVQWIKAKTGNTTTIKAHQGGPTPALPYIMVNMTGTAEVRDHEQNIEFQDADTGDIDTGDIYPDVTASPVVETEWRFSIHSYGPSPTDRLRPIIAASKILQLMEPLFPALVIHEVSQIRNVPDWINSAWQPRGQMDLIIRGLTRDGFVVDVFEDASIIVEKTNP